MSIKDIVLIGILSASLTAGKLALSFVPNVEIVSLLFIVYASVFGMKKSLLVALIFSTTEILIYGFSTWLLGYYIVWPLLVLIVSISKNIIRSEYGYAIIGALFGYLFGMFFALVEAVFYGAAYGFTYWVNGLLFDLVHGTSNFIIVVTLYKPISSLLSRLKASYYQT